MKKLYMIALLLFLFSTAYSQYYLVPFIDEGKNPGGLNTDNEYPVGGGLPAGWSTILSGPQATPSWSAAQNIPFTFEFNGTTVSSYKVSSSGVLTFTTSVTAVPPETNEALPSENIPAMSVTVWGVNAASGDNIVIKTFGTAPNRQHWVQFSSFTESGLINGWTYWSIVLEETTNNIYVVDQRSQCIQGTSTCNGKTSLTVGIQVDSVTAIQVPTSPNVQARTQNEPTPDDNTYYAFIAGNQPANDASITALDLDKVLATPKGPFPIKGRLKNLGSATITSIEIGYALEGETPTTATISSINVGSGDNYLFTHPNTWAPTTTGKNLTLKVWVNSVNGTADANNLNDTLYYIVDIYDDFVERIVLHEVFSSSTCGPCRPGNIVIHSVLDPEPASKYNLVKYQVNWPGQGDPYYTTEGHTRRLLNGITAAPQLVVDGGAPINPNNNGYTSNMFNQSTSIPAFVKVNATHKIWFQNIVVDIEIDPVADISGNNRLFVAVVEKTTYNNVKTNGETEFHNVMKKMLPSANGTSIGNLTKGVKKTYNLKYTFPGDYRLPDNAVNAQGQYTGIDLTKEHSVENFQDLAVVVWVQNMDTREVHQSGSSVRTNTASIDKKDNDYLKVNIYPNPTQAEANLSFTLENPAQVSYRVINLMGQTVSSKLLGNLSPGDYRYPISMNGLAAGVYFVETTAGDYKQTVKISVAK